jgi:predicted metalloprotease
MMHGMALSPDSQPEATLPRNGRRRGIGLIALGALGLGLCFAWSVQSKPAVSAEPPAARGLHDAPSLRAADDKLSAFSRALLEDINGMWSRDFNRRAKPYSLAQPIFFEDGARPECGLPGVTPTGPQCTGTNTAYIDLSFQRELEARFGSAAEGARTYVIAHEMGHHVQRVLGLDAQVQKLLAARPVSTHSVQVQLELQADCFAGVWSRSSSQRLLREPAQVDAALRQASELGTARLLAERDKTTPTSESYTYAIPRRRMYWFYQGFMHAQVQDCDPFASN